MFAIRASGADWRARGRAWTWACPAPGSSTTGPVPASASAPSSALSSSAPAAWLTTVTGHRNSLMSRAKEVAGLSSGDVVVLAYGPPEAGPAQTGYLAVAEIP